jgi:hypothetical protein
MVAWTGTDQTYGPADKDFAHAWTGSKGGEQSTTLDRPFDVGTLVCRQLTLPEPCVSIGLSVLRTGSLFVDQPRSWVTSGWRYVSLFPRGRS